MMHNWLKWLEQEDWTKEGLPLDFPSQRPFYDLPIFRPYLDEFVLSRGLWKPPSYNGKRFVVCVTMDLDSFFTRKEDLRRLVWALRRHNPKIALASLYRMIASKGNTDIEEYLKLYRKYQVRVTFFVPFYLGYSQDPRDPLYSLAQKILFNGQKYPLKEVLLRIAGEGHEIGLHPSIPSAFDGVRLKHEKIGLERELDMEIVSLRQHWLMWHPQKTPRLQTEVGFLYDSTFGFNRLPGFRAGTSYPFRFYKDSVLEVPLILQEGALLKGLSAGALGLSLKRAVELGKIILERIARVGGVAVILVHPYIRGAEESTERLKWLDTLLQEAIHLQARFMTIHEVGDFWKKHYEHLWQETLNRILQSLPPEQWDVWRLRTDWHS